MSKTKRYRCNDCGGMTQKLRGINRNLCWRCDRKEKPTHPEITQEVIEQQLELYFNNEPLTIPLSILNKFAGFSRGIALISRRKELRLLKKQPNKIEHYKKMNADWQNKNKDKLRRYRKKYYEKNKEKILLKNKKYREEHAEEYRKRARKYYAENKEKMRKKANEKYQKRKQQNENNR